MIPEYKLFVRYYEMQTISFDVHTDMCERVLHTYYLQFHQKIHITVDDRWIPNDSFTNRLYGINGNVTFSVTK